MNSSAKKFKDVAGYIASAPKAVQKTLKQIRATVRKASPEAVEGIAYGMPAYKLNGKPLSYFAAFEHHIGFYATPNVHTAFKKELAKYKQGKGSVQFPVDQPIPLALIEKMVKFNAAGNQPKKTGLPKEILAYNKRLTKGDKAISDLLAKQIERGLPKAERKIWHAHPVWFLDGNPIVGYSKLKDGVRLMFWSGASFGVKELTPGTGKFKDASVSYTSTKEIQVNDLARWLKKAKEIQWDYKNIVKRKGKLIRITQK
jgi:uncharacterized protein YdhG (YjbR/CyaY superfamily)